MMPHQQLQVLGTGGDVLAFLRIGLAANLDSSDFASWSGQIIALMFLAVLPRRVGHSLPLWGQQKLASACQKRHHRWMADLPFS